MRPLGTLHTGPLEAMVVLGVVATMLALALPEFKPFMAKARATEALVLSRALILERTLEAAESGVIGLQGAGRHGGHDALERKLAALPDVDAVVSEATRRGRAVVSPGRLQLAIEPPFVVADGPLGEGEPPMRLSWTPAVLLEEPAPAVLLWLCGERSPPPGWFALRDPEPSTIPGARLFAACQARP